MASSSAWYSGKMNAQKILLYRGFTLIELLVVIAIIGILSAVVLASLNTARSKGNYAAVKSNLATIQTQAELYYDSNANTYGATVATSSAACSTASTMFIDPTIKAAISSATLAGSTVTCGLAPGFYDVIATGSGSLTGSNWCINSRGVGTSTTSC